MSNDCRVYVEGKGDSGVQVEGRGDGLGLGRVTVRTRVVSGQA